MRSKLKIIPLDLLPDYELQVGDGVQSVFELLQDSELSIESFSFYTSVSAVFSSKIEGAEMEMDSYIKHKRFGGHFRADYTRKIDDLYEAYMFAHKTHLSEEALESAHSVITRHILQTRHQGKIRTGNMYVLTTDGRIEYVAANPHVVLTEMKKLYLDIEVLLEEKLSFKEVLYFASMLHLVFVKIHPFEDGNGRTARLLEKWFIAEKLGEQAWFIQSEKYYYTHQAHYFAAIRRLGLEYEGLDYREGLSFLLMLSLSIYGQTD